MKWLWPLLCAAMLPATVAVTFPPPPEMEPLHALLFFAWIAVNGALAGYGLDKI